MVQAIFREYDQDMDAASLDEAYMDVTDFCEERSLSGQPQTWTNRKSLHRAPGRKSLQLLLLQDQSFWIRIHVDLNSKQEIQALPINRIYSV